MTSQAPDRYHLVARILHWTMVLAIAGQFLLGYAIERADDVLEWAVDTWFGGADGFIVLAHVLLGCVILVLAIVRTLWRLTAGLPPWAPGLSPTERRVAHRVEQVLYASMFLIPLTGFVLVLISGEDWDMGRGEWEAPLELIDDDVALAAHIATHVAFLGALAIHIGMVLKHQLIDRDGLLRRML